jgi:trk system potassium uptake protein
MNPEEKRIKSKSGPLFLELFRRLLKSINWLNFTMGLLVVISFAILFGFEQPPVEADYLQYFHYFAFAYFVSEKVFRFVKSNARLTYLKENWLEIPMLLALIAVSVFCEKLFPSYASNKIVGSALGIYLIIQVVDKVCRFTVQVAATGRNPMRMLVLSFLVLIVGGAAFLMLPTFHNDTEPLGIIDACFTTTSAACVTGLIVKDTGSYFTLRGQIVILILIQLGGLGIVIFGAVIAQLLGKAFSVSESVAMQDLLNAETISRIGRIIVFVFTFTIVIEAVGALCLFGMWNSATGITLSSGERIFYSIFHSISAFCNAGFALFSDSFTRYACAGEIYWVICPLIIMGGLGFSVIYNFSNLVVDKLTILLYKFTHPHEVLLPRHPKRLGLQSKIVLIATLCLLVVGTVGYLVLMKNHPGQNGLAYEGGCKRVMDAAFMSVTSRTAGFNTIDVGRLSGASKMWTIVLMSIGGSPGSTAGGIKTVTLVIVLMTVVATVLGRREVEVFKRSIRFVIIGRALVVVVFYTTALFVAIFALCITERQSDFSMMDISFEAASAMGTVGLSTGITSSLSSAGKLVITAAMLAGRLGPLTLLASFMFNTKPSEYNYPDEAVVVG